MSKTEITMWKLLIWTYRQQMVQYEVDRAHEHHAVGSMLGDFIGIGSQGRYADRGCINGAGTTAHSDAHVVHAYVSDLRWSDAYLLIQTASKAEQPQWDPAIPEFRVVPSRKGGTGSIRMIWSKSRNAIGCWIDYEGVPKEEADGIRDAARQTYSRWWEALRMLRQTFVIYDCLTRWTVTRTGVPRQPWNLPA